MAGARNRDTVSGLSQHKNPQQVQKRQQNHKVNFNQTLAIGNSNQKER